MFYINHALEILFHVHFSLEQRDIRVCCVEFSALQDTTLLYGHLGVARISSGLLMGRNDKFRHN